MILRVGNAAIHSKLYSSRWQMYVSQRFGIHMESFASGVVVSRVCSSGSRDYGTDRVALFQCRPGRGVCWLCGLGKRAKCMMKRCRIVLGGLDPVEELDVWPHLAESMLITRQYGLACFDMHLFD